MYLNEESTLKGAVHLYIEKCFDLLDISCRLQAVVVIPSCSSID